MKRLAVVLPLLLLAGCTEETSVEQSELVEKQPPAQQDEQTETDVLAEGTVTEEVEAPTEEQQQQQPAQQNVTEPLQFEPVEATTDAGKHYSAMLTNMMTPQLTSYTAQVAVNEQMEWEELGHAMTQIVTLGATITAQQGEQQQRLLTGEYIQEMDDIREQATVYAYEQLDDEYAAYFNEGTIWYRTDPTTMKEQIAVGFYMESIDMLLSHFEAQADQLQLVTETENAATYTLSLSNEAVQPVVKKLLQRDDYNVLAPFAQVDSNVAFTITKGDTPALEQLSIELQATTDTGKLSHSSTLTFTALNETVTIAAPAGIDEAVLFEGP